jgi:hypothetical protein
MGGFNILDCQISCFNDKDTGKKFNPFCRTTYVITKYTAMKEIKIVS